MGFEQIFPLFPVLQWNSDAFPTAEVFVTEASKWIADDQVQWLDCLLAGDLGKVNLHECPTLLDYALFVGQVASDIQLLREGKSGTAILPMTFLSEGNPLEREVKLLRLHWDFLELHKEAEDSWGLKSVFVYLLQLKILARRASFSKDGGRARFDAACRIKDSEAA